MYNKRNDRLECYNQKVADARIKVPKKNIIDLRKENNKGLDQQYLRHEVGYFKYITLPSGTGLFVTKTYLPPVVLL